MKRLLLGLVLSLGMVVGTGARADGGHAGLSLEAGMNFGNVTTPADIQSATRTGYMVGLGLELPVTSFFSIRPELVYAQRGTYLAKGDTYQVTINSHYVEAPVLLKFGFGEKVRPFAFVGPTFVVNLSNDVKEAQAQANDAIKFKQGAFDFAATAGLGVEVGALFVAARYNVGLVSVNENSAQWQSRGVQALLGLNL